MHLHGDGGSTTSYFYLSPWQTWDGNTQKKLLMVYFYIKKHTALDLGHKKERKKKEEPIRPKTFQSWDNMDLLQTACFSAEETCMQPVAIRGSEVKIASAESCQSIVCDV